MKKTIGCALILTLVLACQRQETPRADLLAQEIGLQLCGARLAATQRRLGWLQQRADGDYRRLLKGSRCQVTVSGIFPSEGDRVYELTLRRTVLTQTKQRLELVPIVEREQILLRRHQQRWSWIDDRTPDRRTPPLLVQF